MADIADGFWVVERNGERTIVEVVTLPSVFGAKIVVRMLDSHDGPINFNQVRKDYTFIRSVELW